MKRAFLSVAIPLFLFIAAPAVAQESETSAPVAGYDRGFFLQSEDQNFRLRIGARVQGRYQFESLDAGPDADREVEQQFYIPRARLKLSGHVFDPAWNFTFQADFAKGFVSLKDAFIEYRVPNFRLTLGQFKRPFSRQQLTSSGRLEFVDRAITDRAFGAGRDIGIMAHNGLGADGFEWALGIFNGTGDKARFSGSTTVDPTTGEGDVSGSFSNVPDVFAPAVVARVGYNYGDIRGYREADLEGGPLRFGIGASPQVFLDADDDGEHSVAVEADYSLKVHGFATTGGVYWMSETEDDVDMSTLGFHIQAGYMIGDLVQPAVRFALVDPEGEDNATQEIAGGLSLYFFGHSLKWQSDVALLTTQGADDSTNDIRARSQLQLSF